MLINVVPLKKTICCVRTLNVAGSTRQIFTSDKFFVSLLPMRIYLDTSVIGGVFATVFAVDTQPLFEKVNNKVATILVSNLLEAELLRAPNHVRDFLKSLPKSQIEKVELTNEALKLADTYIAEKVVGKTSLIDCQHIAIATISRADVLASWNLDRKSTRLNSSHIQKSRMPSSA